MPINKQDKGFTLIEVLVSVVVLSIGMLGIAKLQIEGVKNSHTAYTRTQSTQIISSIAESVRSNKEGFIKGFYLSNSRPVVAYNCSDNYAGAFSTTSCSSENIALSDIDKAYDHSANFNLSSITIQCRLAGGGIVSTNTPSDDCPEGSLALITVGWDERTDDAAAQNQVMEFRL